MNNPTDEQLKLCLAKMLPDKLAYDYWGYSDKAVAWNNGRRVLDTEWLHVCWLVEQSVSEQDQNRYTSRLIFSLIGSDNQNLVVWEALTASWQQRALALCRVKGIEAGK